MGEYDFSIDDLDFFIINEIYHEKTTTWNIAKKRFIIPNHLSRIQKLKFMNSKNFLIKTRLNKLCKYGLVLIRKDNENKNEYTLILDNVVIGKHKFPSGYENSCLLKINDYWIAFQTE